MGSNWSGLRLASVVVFVAGAGSALADELDQRVTYRTVAKPAKSVVQELGRAANISLLTSAPMAYEPLIVSAKDRPLREVMDRIAQSVGGEWIREAKSYRLVWNQKQLDEQRRAVVTFEAERLRTKLESLKKELDQFGAYDEARAKSEFEKDRKNQEQIQSGEFRGGGAPLRFDAVVTPATWVLRKMLASMDPTVLAQLPRSSRTVFAMTPTAMQKQLPQSGIQALSSFVRLNNLYAQHQQSLPKGPENEVVIIGDQQSGRPIDSIGEAFLVATKDSEGALILILMVSDSRGMFVARSTHFLDLNVADDSSLYAPNPTIAQEQSISLSEDSKKHAALLTYTPASSPGDVVMFRSGLRSRSMAAVTINGAPSAGNSAPKPSIDSTWRERILNPDKYDPLSFAVSEFLLSTAESKGLDLVASLDDASALALSRRANEGLRPSVGLSILESAGNARFTEKDGWLVGESKLKQVAQRRRADRSSMKALLQETDRDGRLSLQALASYTLKMAEPYSPASFVDRYVGLVSGQSRTDFNDGAGRNFHLLRIWGGLDAVRRNQMLAGEKLPFRLLSTDQRNSAHALVFHSHQGPEIVRQSSGNDQSVNRTVRAFSNGPSFFVGPETEFVTEERTEFMSNGLPANGFIQIEAEFEDAVFATSPSLDEGKFFNAAELGMMQSLSNAASLPSNVQMPQYDRFKIGKRTTLNFELHFNDFASTSRMLRDAEVDRLAKAVAYEQLPEAFRKEVESTRSNVRVGGAPPPPR